MDIISEALKDFGLREREIKVYLTCIKLGSATVYSIAEKISLPKSTVYDILKQLEQKGLCSHLISSGIIYFEAINPEKLLQILEEKKSKIENIIPSLQSLYSSGIKRPDVTVYHGKEGLKSILQDVVKTKKEFLIVGNFSKFQEFFKIYSHMFVENRIKENIYCRLIEEESVQNRALAKDDNKEKRKSKLIKELKDLNSEIYIYGEKIAMLTLVEEEPIGIVIENKDLNKLMRLLFENSWKK
jgi:sugar-specific transcriptional regulator TrmB